MKYLIALFIPPLYFGLERRWLACVGNSVLYVLAWGIVWFVGIVGLLFWLLAAVHALWQGRKEMVQKQAEVIKREIQTHTESDS